jgi:hypothetical protein
MANIRTVLVVVLAAMGFGGEGRREVEGQESSIEDVTRVGARMCNLYYVLFTPLHLCNCGRELHHQNNVQGM